jgi:hypothetical protein
VIARILRFSTTNSGSIYICDECRLNCKVVADERMRRLIHDMPQVFCPFDDREPEFKFAGIRT